MAFRILCLVLVVLLLEALVSANNERPKISDISILLPFSRSRDFVVEKTVSVSPGCYNWHSSNEQVAKAIGSTTEVPGENGCTSNARIISTSTSNTTRTCKVYAVASDKDEDYDEDCPGADQLTVEVYVAPIVRLEILTTMRKIGVNESETISVQAYDAQGNVFSSLDGIQFLWSTSPPSPYGPLTVSMLKETDVLSDGTTNKHNALESLNLFGSTVQITGRATGQVRLTVKLNEAGYEPYKQIEASVLINVTEPIVTCPKAMYRPIYVAMGSRVSFSYSFPRTASGSHCHSSDQVVVTVADGDYRWEAANADPAGSRVAHVDPMTGSATFCSTGLAKLIIQNQVVGSNQATALVQVVKPQRLDLAYVEYRSGSSLPALQQAAQSAKCTWRAEGKMPHLKALPQGEQWEVHTGDTGSSGSRWIFVRGRKYLLRASAMAPLTGSDSSHQMTELFPSDDFVFQFAQGSSTVLREDVAVGEIPRDWPGLRLFEAVQAGTTVFRTRFESQLADEVTELCGDSTPRPEALGTEVTIVVVEPVQVVQPASRTVLLPPIPGIEYTVECSGGSGTFSFSISNPAQGAISSATLVNKNSGLIRVSESAEPGEHWVTCADHLDSSNSDRVRVVVQPPSRMALDQCRREVQIGESFWLSVSFQNEQGVEMGACPFSLSETAAPGAVCQWGLDKAATGIANVVGLNTEQRMDRKGHMVELRKEGRFGAMCSAKSVFGISPGVATVMAQLKGDVPSGLSVRTRISVFAPLQVLLGELVGNYSVPLGEAGSMIHGDNDVQVVSTPVAGYFYFELQGGPTPFNSNTKANDQVGISPVGGNGDNVLKIEQLSDKRVYQVSCVGVGRALVSIKVQNQKSRELPCPLEVTESFEVNCEVPMIAALELKHLVDESVTPGSADAVSSCESEQLSDESKRIVRGQQGVVVLNLLDSNGRVFFGTENIQVSWNEQVTTESGEWIKPSKGASTLAKPVESYKGTHLDFHAFESIVTNAVQYSTTLKIGSEEQFSSLGISEEVAKELLHLDLSASLQVDIVSFLRIRPVVHAPILDSNSAVAYFHLIGGTGDARASLNATLGAGSAEVVAARSQVDELQELHAIKVMPSSGKDTECLQRQVEVTAEDRGLPCASPVMGSLTVSPLARLDLELTKFVSVGDTVQARIYAFPKSGQVPFAASQYEAMNIRLDAKNSRNNFSPGRGRVECLALEQQKKLNLVPSSDLLSCPGVLVVEVSGVETGSASVSAVGQTSCSGSGNIKSSAKDVQVFAPLVVMPSRVVLSPCDQLQLELANGPVQGSEGGDKEVKCRFDLMESSTVVEVSSGGLVTGKHAGKARITAHCELLDQGNLVAELARDQVEVTVADFQGIRLVHKVPGVVEANAEAGLEGWQYHKLALVQGEHTRLHVEGALGENPVSFDPNLSNKYTWRTWDDQKLEIAEVGKADFSAWLHAMEPGTGRVHVEMTAMIPGPTCSSDSLVSKTFSASLEVTVVAKLEFKLPCGLQPVLLPTSSHFSLKTSLDETHSGSLRYSVLGISSEPGTATEVYQQGTLCPGNCVTTVDDSSPRVLRVDPKTGLVTTDDTPGVATVVVTQRSQSGKDGGTGGVLQVAMVQVEVAQIAGIAVRFSGPYGNQIPLGKSGVVSAIPHDPLGREFFSGSRPFPSPSIHEYTEQGRRPSTQRWVSPDGSVEIRTLSSEDHKAVEEGQELPFWSFSVQALQMGQAVGGVWLSEDKRTDVTFGTAVGKHSLEDFFSVRVVNVILPSQNPIRVHSNGGTVRLGLAAGISVKNVQWDTDSTDLFQVDRETGLLRASSSAIGAGKVKVISQELSTVAEVVVDRPTSAEFDLSSLGKSGGMLFNADETSEFVFPVVLHGSSAQSHTGVWDQDALGRVDHNIAANCTLHGDINGLFTVRSVSARTALREYGRDLGTPACVISPNSQVWTQEQPGPITLEASLLPLNMSDSYVLTAVSPAMQVLSAFKVKYVDAPLAANADLGVAPSRFQPGCILLSPAAPEAVVELHGGVQDVEVDYLAASGLLRVDETALGPRSRRVRIGTATGAANSGDFSGSVLLFKHRLTGQEEAVCVSYTTRRLEAAERVEQEARREVEECKPVTSEATGHVCASSQSIHCTLCTGSREEDECSTCDFVSTLVSGPAGRMTCVPRPGVLEAAGVVVVPLLAYLGYMVIARCLRTCTRRRSPTVDHVPVATPTVNQYPGEYPFSPNPNRRYRQVVGSTPTH